MTKAVNLQMVDLDGNVVNERTIEIQDGGNLIVKIPLSYMDTPELLDSVVETLQNFGNGNLLVIPADIELYVLNVKIL